jgi:hypothetical protein
MPRLAIKVKRGPRRRAQDRLLRLSLSIKHFGYQRIHHPKVCKVYNFNLYIRNNAQVTAVELGIYRLILDQYMMETAKNRLSKEEMAEWSKRTGSGRRLNPPCQ